MILMSYSRCQILRYSLCQDGGAKGYKEDSQFTQLHRSYPIDVVSSIRLIATEPGRDVQQYICWY